MTFEPRPEETQGVDQGRVAGAKEGRREELVPRAAPWAAEEAWGPPVTWQVNVPDHGAPEGEWREARTRLGPIAEGCVLLMNINIPNTMENSLVGFRQETLETISHFNTVLTGFRMEDGLKRMKREVEDWLLELLR